VGDPVPSQDTLRGAIVSVFSGISTGDALNGAVGPLLFAENKLPTDKELMNLFRDPTTGQIDVWLLSFKAPSQQGPATGEYYTIWNVQLRYLAVRMLQLDESWAALADFNLETVRTAFEGNDSIFAIGGQQPLLGTPKIVESDAAFAEINGDKAYQGMLRFKVEARRWLP
jgi:hypothetical protein